MKNPGSVCVCVHTCVLNMFTPMNWAYQLTSDEIINTVDGELESLSYIFIREHLGFSWKASS